MKNNKETRTSDYVCVECGVNFLTKLQRENRSGCTTFHLSECGLCEERKPVTNIRHYNHLNKPAE